MDLRISSHEVLYYKNLEMLKNVHLGFVNKSVSNEQAEFKSI